MAAVRLAGTPSLEDIFIRATRQADFTPLARQILDVVEGS